VNAVNRFSRNLIYLLFVVLVVYLLSLRAQRGKTLVVGKWPLQPVVEGVEGVALVKQRGDGSQVLIVKVSKALPKAKVLVQTKDGLFYELGAMQGATFVITLPAKMKVQELKFLRLKGPEGRILAETTLKMP